MESFLTKAINAVKKDYDKTVTKKIIDWNRDITEKAYDYIDKLGEPKNMMNAYEVKKFNDQLDLGKRISEMKKNKIEEKAKGGVIKGKPKLAMRGWK